MSRLDVKRRRRQQVQAQKKLHNTGLVIFIAVLALLVLTVFLVNRNINFLDGFTGRQIRDIVLDQNTVSSISYSFDSGTGYIPYKKSVLVYGRDGVKSISANGDIEWEVSLSLNAPFVSVADSYILIADKGGRQVYILNRDKLVLTSKTQYAIINASITSNGDFVTVTDEPYYNGLVTVKNLRDEEVFMWHSGSGYVVDAVLSGDGRRLTVATVSTRGKIESGILFFNIFEPEPYRSYTYEDCVICKLYNNFDQTVLAVADDRLAGFNVKGEQSFLFDFADRVLEKVAHDLNGVTAVAFLRGTQGSPELNVVDSSRQIVEIQLQGKICYLSVNSGRLAYNDDKNIVIGDVSGKQLYKIKTDKDFKDLILFDDAKRALGVGGALLDVIAVK